MRILASVDKEVYGEGDVLRLTGEVSTFTAQSAYQLALTDPEGKVIRTGVTVDKGQFSWSWTVPTRAIVFGIYKITISSDSGKTDVFFRVSSDPESESALLPLTIETDKAFYNTGETLTVFGSAIVKARGSEGLVIPTRPEIIIKSENNKEIAKAFADLNTGGKFQATFKLIPRVYETGEYKVIAKYYDAKDQTVFKVDNRYRAGGDAPLILLLDTDKEKYLLGETVEIDGKTSRIISLKKPIDLVIEKVDPTKPTCGSFVCGGLSPIQLKLDSAASFDYKYEIPNSPSALGSYIVKARTGFATVTDTFEVVSELPPVEVEEPTEVIPTTPIPTPKKIVDTVSRITKSSIPISIGEKIVDDMTFSPTLFYGLLRTSPNDESDVNIKVTIEDGTCLIGQDSSCKITKSTRGATSLYQIVEIDGTNLKVRYSGPGSALEKFTILPEDPDDVIPDGKWNVEIIKDNQISRFYYKISYTSTE